MERRFDGLQMEHVPRAMNVIADELSKLAARREPVPPGVFIERLTHPSIAVAKPKLQRPPCPGKGALASPPGSREATHPGGQTSTSLAGDPIPGYPDNESPEKDLLPEKHAVLAVERQVPPWAVNLLNYLQY